MFNNKILLIFIKIETGGLLRLGVKLMEELGNTHNK